MLSLSGGDRISYEMAFTMFFRLCIRESLSFVPGHIVEILFHSLSQVQDRLLLRLRHPRQCHTFDCRMHEFVLSHSCVVVVDNTHPLCFFVLTSNFHFGLSSLQLIFISLSPAFIRTTTNRTRCVPLAAKVVLHNSSSPPKFVSSAQQTDFSVL